MTYSLFATDRAHSVLAVRRTPVIRHINYRPFGAASHRHARGRVAFNGQWREPGTGHYALGNGYRSYSTEMGRFLRPDLYSPFDKGGLNSYAYCAAEPVNRRDPDGEAFSAIAIAGLVSSVSTLFMHVGTIGSTSAKQIKPAMRWAAFASIMGAAVSIASLSINARSPESPVATPLAWAGVGLAVTAAALRLSVSVPAMIEAGPYRVLGRLFGGPLGPGVRAGPSGMEGRILARR
ncbi:RHS repeat-associated core domain-containing protein [Pseudomonas sp. RIT-PI-S]|uniref:RHS repeat-associated core domain-containing protein n=1 Tax=Pseudomonas sp. RIT-PI-S TaxID=3035295 RepID=UPI0021DAF1D0|nr:RHS repeat-associated core domain-containing protein [Pseudomonas sp. RIT-PI-S]